MVESNHVRKSGCVKCEDSKWNAKHLSIYDDGHTYCHRCKTYTHSPDIIESISGAVYDKNKGQFIGKFQDLPERGLTKETCEFLGIMKGSLGSKEDCYLYMLDNGLKVRLPNKDFPWIEGSSKECSMFGLDRAVDYNSPIVITEGEFDTASIYQVGMQACSLLNGNTSAEVSLNNSKEELLKYQKIWLGLDNDKAGKEAYETIIKIFTEWGILDKVCTVDWQHVKDANDALLDVLYPDIDNTTRLEYILKEKVIQWKPEGIVFGNNLNIKNLREVHIESITVPAPLLNESFGGLDRGCFYLFLAGVGVGKSTILTEWSLYWYKTLGLKVANLFYEEDEDVTPLRYIALENNIPIGKLRRDRTLMSEEQWKKAESDFISTDRTVFLDKTAKRDSNELFTFIEYLVTVKKFDVIIIDHISYIIGRSQGSKQGERRDIDELIYNLQDLTRRLKCIILAVSHVTESKKEKNWDEGEIPSLYSGRGSKALAQIPDGIIGASRNMKDEWNQHVITLYNLKNRWGGKLGKMDDYLYIDSTGRLELR